MKRAAPDNNKIFSRFTVKSLAIMMTCALILLLIGVGFVYHTWEKNRKEAKAKALSLAESAAAFLDIELISSLEWNATDADKPGYQQIKSSLAAFKAANEDVYTAYIYTLLDENLYFIADSEDPDSEYYSPPGQEYTEAKEVDKQPFSDGQPLLTDPMTDRWGTWVSALVPIVDKDTGEVIAVFGVDYSAAEWGKAIYIQVAQTFVILACILLLILTIHRITIKNATLRSITKELRDSEILFRTVFEQSPIGVAIGQNHRLVSHINPVFESITGRSKAELMDMDWTQFTHPDDLQADLENFTKFKAGETDGYTMEKRFLKPTGADVWVQMTIAPLQFSNDENKNHLCLIEDISERIQSEQNLRESERSKTVLLSQLPGMAYRCKYTANWTMEFISDGSTALTGYSPSRLMGNDDLTYHSLVVPDYREMLWNEITRAVRKKQIFRIEYEIATLSGANKWVLETGQGIYHKDDELEALEGIIIDITDQKLQQKHIQYLNEYDFMTGLHSRSFFEKEKVRLDAKEYLPLSVITGDINGLRIFNDAFGYTEGNRIIKETAKIMKSYCREGDILARTGGDDFTILLPNTDMQTADEIVNQIKRTCQGHTMDKDKEKAIYGISLSLGYSTKETEEKDMDQTIKQAVDAMYKRKLLSRKSSHSAILSSIVATMYARSHETEAHSERMIVLSKLLGMKLNLPQHNLDDLELYALVHDIGKVGVDDSILNKPGPLTEKEWVQMRKHSEIGYRIVMSSQELETIAEYVLCHHERWDGKGYPRGLKGQDIPLLSRILSIVDAYDAMTEDRVYRKGMSKADAIMEIRNNAGTQFDPEIAAALIDILSS